MKVKGKNQQQIDKVAEKEGKATGSDQLGGQDKINPPRRELVGDGGPSVDSQKPQFKGVRIHDSGPDTWGMKKTPRYERD